MRSTSQYAQWQRIRQNNDSEANRLAKLLLAREDLLQEQAKGKSINWQDFDRLTAQVRQAGLNLPTSQEIQASKKGSPAPTQNVSGVEQPPAVTPAKALLKDENMLVLSVVCPAVGLKQEIVGYGDQQTTLLPLGGVAHALDFDLTVDAKKNTATGWFISEDRTISLDAKNRTVKIDGKTYPWDDDKIVVGDDDIYVDSRVLSKWLPVDFKTSLGNLPSPLSHGKNYLCKPNMNGNRIVGIS